jgi:hypothetical protein
MRDTSHMDKVELWANFVRDHPDEWRKQLNPFIDAQINKANEFYKRLAKTPGGKNKVDMVKRLRIGKIGHPESSA